MAKVEIILELNIVAIPLSMGSFLYASTREHHDSMSQRFRFFLIMRHVHRGRA